MIFINFYKPFMGTLPIDFNRLSFYFYIQRVYCTGGRVLLSKSFLLLPSKLVYSYMSEIGYDE